MVLIDCREASLLTSAEPDRPLTLRELIGLHIHRLLCAPCRLYRRQLELLRRQAAKLPVASPDHRLDATARERIRARLRNAVDSDGDT